MKKYFIFFTVSSCFGISNSFGQSAATAKQVQAEVVTDSAGKSDDGSHGTISKAGRNQQSVYTPPASNSGNTAPAQGGTPTPQLASPAKGQATAIDPKKD